MDYTSNNNTQRMRQSMGPVDQPNWNGGPSLDATADQLITVAAN